MNKRRISNEISGTGFWRLLNNPKLVFWLTAILFVLYFLPYIAKGEDVFIPQFDNLDQMSYLGHFDGRFQGHFLLKDEIEEYYLPGMEPVFRLAVLSFPKIFWLLGFFWGYAVNEFFYRLLAFIGFYLFLKHYIMKGLPRIYPALISIAYIYLPFWPQGGLSVSGLPLLAYLLMNIYQKKQVQLSYLFLFIYCTYSGFFLTGIFVLAILGLLILVRMFKRLSYRRLIIPFLLMTMIYVLTNYPYFLINFVYKIPTNRSEIQILSKDLANAWNELFLKYFITSHRHAPSFHQYLLLPVTVISGILMFRNRSFKLRKLSIFLMGFLIISALFFAIYRFGPVNDLYTKLGFGFDYSRLFFLNPPIWYILIGISITFFYSNYQSKKTIQIIFLIILLAQISINYHFSSYKTWTGSPSFREVVSEKQFDEIAEYLSKHEAGFSKKETRIGCVGFQPAVANFNGLRTLGAYCPIYPLHLKQTFMDILEGEMAKNPRLRLYMDKWGSQLYLFDDQIFIGMLDQRYLRSKLSFITCELDTALLKELGVDYLFCTARVTNASEKALREVYRERNPFHYYRFYIYAID